MNEMKINNWKQATTVDCYICKVVFTHSPKFPHFNLPQFRIPKYNRHWMEIIPADIIGFSQKEKGMKGITADALVDFVKREQLTRWESHTSEEFANFASIIKDHASTDSRLYLPRHGDKIHLFQNKFLGLFEGVRGLDVGCRVFPGDMPHYEYYKKAGARMIGIDIFLCAPRPAANLYRENVLDLSGQPFCQKNYFDFITVPMIFGYDNPVSSVLGIAIGLSELARVLNNAGLIYIANDNCLDLGVAYVAQRIGFRAFFNDTIGNLEIPCGMFLIKANATKVSDHFQKLIDELEAKNLELPDLATLESDFVEC